MDPNVPLAAASVLLLAAFIAFFAFLIRHQEQVEPEDKPAYGVELLRQHYAAGETIEQPTPYWVAPIPASPDPLEISANLDKKIVIGAAMLFFVFFATGGYFVIQGPNPLNPTGGLRAAAVEHQLLLDVRRGKETYASLCYDCHGRDGKGGTTPEGKALPGLPLNQPGNKAATLAADEAALKDRRRLLELTIERGRPQPPPQYSMPSWARSEGGQLSPWQVKQLVDFLMHGTEEDWADVVHIRVAHDEPDHSAAEKVPPPPAVASGREVIAQNCGACHSIDLNKPSVNPLSPNLAKYKADGAKPINEPLRALAARDPAWLFQWISNPPAIKPDTQMPPQHQNAKGPLNDEAIRKIVAFLTGQEDRK